MLLISVHLILTMTVLLTRNMANVQALLFTVMLFSVYFSENINIYAAERWRSFSRQQYFDSKGMFISIIFSIPMLFNCMIMVANWLWQSSELLTQLKVAQMRQMMRQNTIPSDGNATEQHEKNE
ncbi:transmembrane protein 18 isoform X2 [Neocloeon triangulifer]|nr:transmembrane protein 18 isoform X2 [Neocloeon triangulifer]